MKRNRLVSTSSQENLFAISTQKILKYRTVIIAFLFVISSISITSIVLATSAPDENKNTPDISHYEEESIKNNSVELSDEEQQYLNEITANNLIEIATVKSQRSWQEVTVESGDNLSLIFPRIGLTARDVYNITQLDDDIKPLLNLKPGQVLRFNLSKDGEITRLHQLELKLSPIAMLTVFSGEEGYKAQLDTRDVVQKQRLTSGIISTSLFEAGTEAGLSDNITMELAYIFGWDIDFALDLRKGDSFSLIYSEDFLDGEKIADGKVLAAEFTNRDKTFRAIRYTDATGHSQYYSPKGNSMRKAFSRTPVHFSRISSKFNPNRKHPLLKITRPHRGVDYAAARGTPILATGDGKISFRGTKGGYGRTVILSHAGKYTTLYAHMSKFKKGLKKGSRVKQGQTIGYIGRSGTATGYHLHYEFRINGVHRNPLTVKLPKAASLAKKYRQDFEEKAQPLLAQLDNIDLTALALSD